MRISDWSSDVCSSDLYSRGFNVYTTINSKDQEAAYHAVREGILGYTRRARYTGPDGNIDLPDGIENQPDKLDELLEAVRDTHPDNGCLLTGVVLPASHTKVVVARRSEQPTSELQSLMRTTYAVFSLKKQNHYT